MRNNFLKHSLVPPRCDVLSSLLATNSALWFKLKKKTKKTLGTKFVVCHLFLSLYLLMICSADITSQCILGKTKINIGESAGAGCCYCSSIMPGKDKVKKVKTGAQICSVVLWVSSSGFKQSQICFKSDFGLLNNLLSATWRRQSKLTVMWPMEKDVSVRPDRWHECQRGAAAFLH